MNRVIGSGVSVRASRRIMAPNSAVGQACCAGAADAQHAATESQCRWPPVLWAGTPGTAGQSRRRAMPWRPPSVDTGSLSQNQPTMLRRRSTCPECQAVVQGQPDHAQRNLIADIAAQLGDAPISSSAASTRKPGRATTAADTLPADGAAGKQGHGRGLDAGHPNRVAVRHFLAGRRWRRLSDGGRKNAESETGPGGISSAQAGTNFTQESRHASYCM